MFSSRDFNGMVLVLFAAGAIAGALLFALVKWAMAHVSVTVR